MSSIAPSDEMLLASHGTCFEVVAGFAFKGWNCGLFRLVCRARCFFIVTLNVLCRRCAQLFDPFNSSLSVPLALTFWFFHDVQWSISSCVCLGNTRLMTVTQDRAPMTCDSLFDRKVVLGPGQPAAIQFHDGIPLPSEFNTRCGA